MGATGGYTPAPFRGDPAQIHAWHAARRRGPTPGLRRLPGAVRTRGLHPGRAQVGLSLIHISEPTRLALI
eukprot:2995949-Alexandrium_andersonii.AAC.1